VVASASASEKLSPSSFSWRVDGELLALVAVPPAALVAGLMQGDAVDPGAEAGVAAEAGDVAEDLDEDLLRDVGGVGRVAEVARDERVDRVAVLRDEQGKGLLGAGLELRDEVLLVSARSPIALARSLIVVPRCEVRLKPSESLN
jgi:hypothetical protein